MGRTSRLRASYSISICLMIVCPSQASSKTLTNQTGPDQEGADLCQIPCEQPQLWLTGCPLTFVVCAAKKCFSNLDIHVIYFKDLSTSIIKSDKDLDYKAPTNGISSNVGLICMIFSKSKVEDRNWWFNHIKNGTFLNRSQVQDKGVSNLNVRN